MVVAANWMLSSADGEDRLPSSEELDSSDPGPDLEPAGLSVGVLFDRVLDAVVIAKLTTGRIVGWNRAAEQLFGHTAQQAIGQSIEILMPEPITHLHRVGIERYLRTGHGLLVDADSPVEMPARTRDGEQIRVEMKLSELRNARGERYVMAVIRDAMHRKRIELLNLELAQARVARSEAETELDVRDKLIDAMTSRLSERSNTSSLYGALEDYRRLRNGELVFRPMDGELVDLVHAAVDAVRRQATGRRLLVFTVPSVPATFDAARTRQLLGYLLEEAIGGAPEGASIEVHVDQPTPQVAQLTVRAPGAKEPGVGYQVARALAHRQKGTLAINETSSGQLEVVLTLPGRPHPARRKPGRIRPGRDRVSVP
jgi:PAS domain S-box-containing protein